MPAFHTPRLTTLATRDTLALVLAGGRGTRLGGLTRHRVKPAVPFGGNYRLIDFTVSNCINSGIRRVAALTQYKPHSLIRHLEDTWGFLRPELNEFVEILPAQQRTDGGWYNGTANAVYQNLDIIHAHAPQFVLVLGGDHVYKMDYGALLAHHLSLGAAVTVGCVEVNCADACAFGVAVLGEGGRIRQFQEKSPTPAQIPDKPGLSLASMGVYVFQAENLMQVLEDDQQDPASRHDFGQDILPRMIRNGQDVRAFAFRDLSGNTQGYWRDIGNLDAYWEANLELTSVTPPLDLYDRTWPIWSWQEQAPPAKFVFDDEHRRGWALDSLVSGGCIVSGARVRQSLLFPFVRVQDGASLEQVVALPRVQIGAGSRIRKTVIESGCMLPAGSVIGHDPDEDAKRFEVSARGVVLVTPESLGQRLPYVL